VAGNSRDRGDPGDAGREHDEGYPKIYQGPDQTRIVVSYDGWHARRIAAFSHHLDIGWAPAYLESEIESHP
jgi:hypothetical protein